MTKRTTLAISPSGLQFELDGVPQFLAGMSYYGALSADSPRLWERDLDDLWNAGMRWIRVWATWEFAGENVSAVDPEGAIRQPYMRRLRQLVDLCDRRGMVVDVTVSRGKPPFPAEQPAHLKVIRTLAEALKPWRNVYIDVGNERDIRDARHVPWPEVGELIRAIKQIDPGRLCTASSGFGIERELMQAIGDVGRLDMICPHLERTPNSAQATLREVRRYRLWMRSGGRYCPVHLQEPFRRGYTSYNPPATLFVDDLRAALRSGAAGWCFHNGAEQGGKPYRCFRISRGDGRLMDQLDGEERKALEGIAEVMRRVEGA